MGFIDFLGDTLDMMTPRFGENTPNGLAIDIASTQVGRGEDERDGILDSTAQIIGDAAAGVSEGVGFLGDQAESAWNAPVTRATRAFVGEETENFQRGWGAINEPLEALYERGTRPARKTFSAARIARTRAVRDGEDPGSLREWSYFFEEETWDMAAEAAETTSLGQGFQEMLLSSTFTGAGIGGRMAESVGIENRFAPTEEELARLRQEGTEYNIGSGMFDAAARWYLDPLVIAGKAAGVARTAGHIRPVRPGEDLAGAAQGKPRRWNPANIARRTETLHSDRTKGWGAYDFLQGSDSIRRSDNPVAFATAAAFANRLGGADRADTMKMVERVAIGDSKAIADLEKRRPELADLSMAAKNNIDEAVETYKAEMRTYRRFPELKSAFGVRDDLADVRNTHRQRIRRYQDEMAHVEDDLDFADFMQRELYGVARSSVPQVTKRGARKVNRSRKPQEAVRKPSLWGPAVRVVDWGRDAADVKHMRANGIVQLDAPDSYREVEAFLDGAERLFPSLRGSRREKMNRYLEQNTPQKRENAIAELEQGVLREAIREHRLPEEFADEIFGILKAEREKIIGSTRGQSMFSVAPDAAGTGKSADMMFLDGEWVRHPLLSSQQRNKMPMMNAGRLKDDLDKHADQIRGEFEWLEESGISIQDVLDGGLNLSPARAAAAREAGADMLNRVSSAWKGATLLRLGYPLRNMLESNLRTTAKFGASANMAQMEGVRNFTANMAGRIPQGRRAMEAYNDDVQRLDNIRGHIDDLEGALKANPADAEGLVTRVSQARDEATAIEARVKRLKGAKTKDFIEEYGLRRELGTQEFPTSAGRVEGPFSGPDAPAIKSRTGAGGMYRRLYFEGRGDDAARRELLAGMTQKAEQNEKYRLEMDWNGARNIDKADPEHNEAWVHAINFQLRNDPMARHMLEGKTDDWLANWLRRDSEGRQHARSLPAHRSEPERWVANVRQTLDTYAPTLGMREIARRREVTLDDVKRFKRDHNNQAPSVHGPQIDHQLGRGAPAKGWNKSLGKWLDFISTGPETKLARHPHYVIAYRDRARREVDNIMQDPNRKALGKDKHLDTDDWEHVRRRAHQYAQKSLTETLYDASRRTNSAHALRWVSPFMMSHQDSLSRWWNLGKDSPEIAGRANLLWQVPAKAGTVVDEDGNLVQGRNYQDSDKILFAWPTWMGGPTEDDPMRGTWAVNDARMTMSLDTLNVVFPGSPWWSPGLGPLAQVPLGYARREMSEYDAIWEKVDPYGPVEPGIEGAAKTFLPQWARRAAGLVLGTDDHQYAGYVNWMYAQDMGEWDKNGQVGDKPTLKDANDKVRALYMLKIGSLAGSPFQVNFQPKYQHLRDAYHQLQEQSQQEGHDQEWVFQQFRDNYPDSLDLLVLAMGTSENNTGLFVSPESIAAKEEYQSLVNKHPDFAAGVIGSAGQEGEWNPSAYSRAMDEPVVEGGGTNWLERENPDEAIKNNRADLGWKKYRQVMNMIDAYASDAGLATYKESDRLVRLRQDVVAELQQENHDWWADYREGQQDFSQTLAGIRNVIDDKAWEREHPQRSDIPALHKYFAVREKFQEELESRSAAGGAKTMQAQANEDLALLWTQVVGELASTNVQFSDNWYHRYLQHDPWLLDDISGGA